MPNLLQRMKRYFLSWFNPQDTQVVLLGGDQEKLDLSTLSREEIKAIGKRDAHLAKYYPWPESYFILVGTVIDTRADTNGTLLYRLRDPVSSKEFILTREVLNILFYRK